MDFNRRNRYLATASVFVFLVIVVSLVNFQITGEVTNVFNDSENPELSISERGVSDGASVGSSFLVSLFVQDEFLDYLEYNWNDSAYKVPLDFLLSYDFNEAGVLDSSVNQNDGEGSGYDIKSGVFDSGYDFSNGANVDTSNLGLDLSSDSFSLTGWVKSDSSGKILESSDGFVLRSTEMDWISLFLKNDLHYIAPNSVFGDSDYLYVSDSYSSKIVKFKKDNLAIVDFYGENGSSQSQLYDAKGIFVDDNYLYVADSGNHRILQLDKNNFSYVSQFGETGVSSDTNSTLNNPLSVFVYNSTIYVLDSGNSKLKVLDNNMSYVSEYFSNGAGDLELNSPRGFYVNQDFVYIADALNHKVKVFNKENMSLNYTIGSSAGSSIDQFNLPYDVFVDDNLYFADFRNNRIKKHFMNGTYGGHVGRIDFSKRPDISSVNSLPFVDEDYLYMIHPSRGGVIMVNKTDFSLVGKNRPYGIYDLPVSMTSLFVEGDYIYFADTVNYSLGRYWKNNFSLDFAEPIEYSGIGIGYDEEYIYLSDYYNGKIDKYYKNNFSLVDSYGSLGTGVNQLRYAWNVFVDDNFVYIPDNYNHRVVKVWKSNMTYHSHLGTRGSGQNQYNYILGIGGDSEHLYVADFNNKRIKKIYKENLTYADSIFIPLPPVGLSRSNQAAIGISEIDGVLYVNDYSRQNYLKIWAENMTIFDSTEDVFSLSSTLSENDWNHFAVVVNRSEDGHLDYKFYLNGELQSNYSGNYFMGFEDSPIVTIGGSNSFDGMMDNFRVYDYALDIDRVNGDMIANFREEENGMLFELNQDGVLSERTYEYSATVYDKAGNSESIDLSVVGDSESKVSSAGYIAILEEDYIYREAEAYLDEYVEFEFLIENENLHPMRDVSVDIVENDNFDMETVDLSSEILAGDGYLVDILLNPKRNISLQGYRVIFEVNGVFDQGQVQVDFYDEYLVNLTLVELPEPVEEIEEEREEIPQVDSSEEVEEENSFIVFIIVGILVLIFIIVWVLYRRSNNR